MEEVSFMNNRKSSALRIKIKLKKHFFKYFIDTRSGIYKEKALFDNIICLKRF